MGSPKIETKSDCSETEEKAKKKEPRMHQCTYKGCNQSFSRPWRLKAHLCTHSGEKLYLCDLEGCGKAYTNRQHLNRHKQTSHSENPPEYKTYVCTHPPCQVTLKTKQNLSKHIERFHSKKCFSCKECDKSFNTENKLIQHSFEHSGEPLFKCMKCNMGFTRIREYKRHNRGHQLHICPTVGCTEVFSEYKLLRKHISTHPGFTCDLCWKRFVKKSRLECHIEKHLAAMSGEKPFRSQSLPQGPFPCHICLLTLTTKASLERHVRNIHSVKPDIETLKVKAEKKRAERKDKGKPKRSFASVLSCIELPSDINKFLISENEKLLDL